MNNPNTGSSFLHEKNPRLHSSQEVETVVGYLRSNGESIPNEPADKIAAYVGFLANREYANDGTLTGDQASTDRQIERAIIATTPDNARRFAKFEAKVAREEGVRFSPEQLPDDKKIERLRIQREDQRKQLHEWVGYLNDKDTDYPDWFKHYTLESLKGLTKFDEEKQAFGKRSANSFALYPQLDRESLAVVFDVIKRRQKGMSLAEFTPEMQKAAQSGNFAKLYAEANKLGFAITPELRQNLDGTWQRYASSGKAAKSDLLAHDVARYRTGWCTAGRETAHTQLTHGDFYVFYTSNEDGKKNVPRVAIRMEKGEVREVRGIEADQSVETELLNVVLQKVKDLPGGEGYVRKAENMKRLTALEKKISSNADAELTREEVRFLYELDGEIEGFGYDRDPRIDETRAKRGYRDKSELARMLPESIREQLTAAYSAYRTVTHELLSKQRGVFRMRELAAPVEELERLFAAKDKQWQANGVYDYLVDQLIENGIHFNLVAAPNIEASGAQLVALAKKFGKGQPSRTMVYGSLFHDGEYNSREWSGNVGDDPVRFSLIQNRADPAMSVMPVSTQVRMLHERQMRNPQIDIRIPTLLDTLTYWYGLRARGDILNGDGVYSPTEKTSVRYINLEPKMVYGHPFVPAAHLDEDGRPYLNADSTDSYMGSPTRIAIG